MQIQQEHTSIKIKNYQSGNQYTFRHHQILGQGAFSQVYQGKHTFTSQIVAIKIILKKRYSLETIKRQIQILQNIKHHNIVQFKQFFSDEKYYYIITQFCQYSLYDYMQKNKISQKKVYQFFVQLIEGIYQLHKNNYFHRDLKPENILLKNCMFSNNMVLKICDFGISRTIQNQAKYTRGKGTIIYSPPNIILGKDYTEKCDIWSAGLIIYRLLVKAEDDLLNDLLSIQMVKEFHNDIKQGRKIFEINADIRVGFRQLILKMLRYEECERPSIEEIQNQIRKMKGDIKIKSQIKLVLGQDNIQKCVKKDISQLKLKKNINKNQDPKYQFQNKKNIFIYVINNIDKLYKFSNSLLNLSDIILPLYLYFITKTQPQITYSYQLTLFHQINSNIPQILSKKLKNIHHLSQQDKKNYQYFMKINQFQNIYQSFNYFLEQYQKVLKELGHKQFKINHQIQILFASLLLYSLFKDNSKFIFFTQNWIQSQPIRSIKKRNKQLLFNLNNS